MINQPATPSQSEPQLPTETTLTGMDVTSKTYELKMDSVIFGQLWEIGKILFYLAGGIGIGYSVFRKEFNISQNTFIVIVSILAVIVLVISVIILWNSINFARKFRIISDSTGLTLKKDKESIEIHWNEVTGFQDYELKGTKDVIKLPPELRQRDILKEVIEKNAAKSITEHLVSKFHQEGKVTLGIIEITTKGILVQKEFIPWEEIASIGIDEENYLRVIEKSDSNSVNTVSTSGISNLNTRRIALLSTIPYSYALGALLDIARPRPIVEPVVLKNIAKKSVFICYRREDSIHISDRIFEHLIRHFGEDAIFKDIHSIPLGVDFRFILDEEIGKCQVLLAIIGDQWLSITNNEGKRRLDDSGDFVRIEIESALKRKIPVIPLLVGKTSMPSQDDLPEGLKELAFRNGIPIRPDPTFHHDMSRLIKSLENHLSEISKRDAA